MWSKERLQTAKKRHQCETCGRDIAQGELYCITIFKDDGLFWTYKEHVSCSVKREQMCAECEDNPATCCNDAAECFRDEYQKGR